MGQEIQKEGFVWREKNVINLVFKCMTLKLLRERHADRANQNFVISLLLWLLSFLNEEL